MMTLDEINRLRALKAKDDGIAFDLEVLTVADQLLDAAERLEQAERDHAAVLDSVKAAHVKELEGVFYWKHKAEERAKALAAEVQAWRSGYPFAIHDARAATDAAGIKGVE